MRRDGLGSVIRLRRLAQAEARRVLADRLAAETAAEAAVGAAEAAIERERAAALDLAAGDSAVEAFGAWLPVGREVCANAEAKHATALAETAGRGRNSARRGRPWKPPSASRRHGGRPARTVCSGSGSVRLRSWRNACVRRRILDPHGR